ncbi:nicotinate-nucleotide pyrophosphorylase [carboxylating] [Humibacillus xanthopallidus]|uniref:Nicotinate-nucleotide pyrophosphorylase [carboxylating] n=1 Tax=Humibacillus xanthopallidus TaxID=412689 RepID=A0A543PMR1_9MICO|nr:carboxylating nicotinate-nucleotide diphosphorylase [Humibacillus xanthopallidus]TQN45368.1 nicotinate-nucleotide pyrophosphorylase [carboxylating] [Humibacillus xanthopallidus]
MSGDGLSGFPLEWAQDVVRVALLEDLGPDGVDVTTQATIPADQRRVAEVVARAPGVVAGVPVIDLVLAAVAETVGRDLAEADVTVEVLVDDGGRVERGDVIARLSGSTQVILVAERTMLNILSRLSGVATHTRRWADALDGTGAMVLDTRKTTPGLRWLEKYAVRCGGGTNKRMGLYDVAMIKDNHKLAAGSVAAAYDLVRQRFPDVTVQVEVTTQAEAQEAYDAGARFIMCDNMSVEVLGETVALLRAAGESVEIEATGGMTLEVARDYALTGVDFISVGGLTHSSPIVDIALDLV